MAEVRVEPYKNNHGIRQTDHCLVDESEMLLKRLYQWSTGLGFDGLLQKACLVVGLSRPMDNQMR